MTDNPYYKSKAALPRTVLPNPDEPHFDKLMNDCQRIQARISGQPAPTFERTCPRCGVVSAFKGKYCRKGCFPIRKVVIIVGDDGENTVL